MAIPQDRFLDISDEMESADGVLPLARKFMVSTVSCWVKSLVDFDLLSKLMNCSIHVSTTNVPLSVKRVVQSALKRGAVAEWTSAIRLSQVSCSSRSFCCTIRLFPLRAFSLAVDTHIHAYTYSNLFAAHINTKHTHAY